MFSFTPHYSVPHFPCFYMVFMVNKLTPTSKYAPAVRETAALTNMAKENTLIALGIFSSIVIVSQDKSSGMRFLNP